MANFEMIDALTGDAIVQDESTGNFIIGKGDKLPKCSSIFFPGCSMINYAMPLTIAVYDTLREYERVDGVSLLCCGKILSYEQNGEEVRRAFTEQLCDHIAQTDISKIVCACPNCVKALKEAFAKDDRLGDIEICVLGEELVDIGFKLDKETVAQLLGKNPADDVLLCPHDSCPDRETGQFADAIRAIMPEGLWRDPEHCRHDSICCGSLPRAKGKVEAADRCADICASESVDVSADAIVTSCMSCAFQLNMAQDKIPAVHFLELLYNWRINWKIQGGWMKVRFLFDDTLGVVEATESSRTFEGLTSATSKDDDPIRDRDVAISDDDVEEIGL